jgi:eukaryotic-like serine/threonine-protein kinase
MEIAAGGTLKDKLKKRGPLPAKEAVDAILDVIAGLEAAFQAGVLHRDIKPSNCFVSPDGSVKIGDFGISLSTLAKDDTYVTATGVIVGTPAYASPEQLRGDTVDVRADIYSVGATLFTLLTGRAPFEGENAVQVVAHAVNQKPKPLTEFRKDVPPGLERVVARCLAKEPDGRYGDYKTLRHALLPFSSQVPEPAAMEVRALAGWIDYLAAFLIPYVVIMLSVGGAQFQIQPLVDRTLYSARYYFLFLGLGFMYFSITEGLWGAGLGKRLMGLCVVRTDGRVPGIGRALFRIFIPIFCIEVVRIPFLLTTISLSDVNAMTSAQVWLYVGACNVCPWLAVLLALRARRENGFATVWDQLSGTRVVVQLKGAVRMPLEPVDQFIMPREDVPSMGPYQVVRELVSGKWIVAFDPLLRRPVWLIRQGEPALPLARKNVSRIGRLHWLQTIEANGARWNAFEAAPGTPFSSLVKDGKRVPWEILRQWLHDLAAELWAASSDRTLPAELGLDHIWITREGYAVLLEHPWPEGEMPTERIRVGDLAGQQRFLSAVAARAESTTLPLHARPVLQNLAAGKFEKLSFLAGNLRGLLAKPAEVTRRIRAGCMLLLPVYIWIMVFIGYERRGGGPETIWSSEMGTALATALVVLGSIAVAQLLELPFRNTASYAIFRLAVINPKGERASVFHLLGRWAIMWLSLFLPILLVVFVVQRAESFAFMSALVLFLLWLGAAAYGVVHPYRGLPDRLVGTWVVRR